MDTQSFISGLELNKMSVMDVISVIASGAMVFGGVVPYIPQYRTIRRTLSSEGFSTLVCFVLLVANMLRVCFWFGKHYELPLLAQSLLMIAAMLAMVEICVRVKNQSEIVQSKQHTLRGPSHEATSRTFYQSIVDLDWNAFWKWTDFLSYVECMLLIAAIFSLTTYIFIDNYVYVEVIGFLSVFIEAMLGTPQLYKNFANRSTTGMSVSMVVMWLTGDLYKTGYFIVRHAPIQFWVCGGIQICVDIAILGQVFYYSMFPAKGAVIKHSK